MCRHCALAAREFPVVAVCRSLTACGAVSLQPGDPIEYMVRYLVQNRSDLRKHVVRCEWLPCARRGLPSARAC